MNWKNKIGICFMMTPITFVIIGLFYATVVTGKWLEMFIAFGVVGVMMLGGWLVTLK